MVCSSVQGIMGVRCDMGLLHLQSCGPGPTLTFCWLRTRFCLWPPRRKLNWVHFWALRSSPAVLFMFTWRRKAPMFLSRDQAETRYLDRKVWSSDSVMSFAALKFTFPLFTWKPHPTLLKFAARHLVPVVLPPFQQFPTQFVIVIVRCLESTGKTDDEWIHYVKSSTTPFFTPQRYLNIIWLENSSGQISVAADASHWTALDGPVYLEIEQLRH